MNQPELISKSAEEVTHLFSGIADTSHCFKYMEKTAFSSFFGNKPLSFLIEEKDNHNTFRTIRNF